MFFCLTAPLTLLYLGEPLHTYALTHIVRSCAAIPLMTTMRSGCIKCFWPPTWTFSYTFYFTALISKSLQPWFYRLRSYQVTQVRYISFYPCQCTVQCTLAKFACSLCLRGFLPGTPAFSHTPKTCTSWAFLYLALPYIFNTNHFFMKETVMIMINLALAV